MKFPLRNPSSIFTETIRSCLEKKKIDEISMKKGKEEVLRVSDRNREKQVKVWSVSGKLGDVGPKTRDRVSRFS